MKLLTLLACWGFALGIPVGMLLEDRLDASCDRANKSAIDAQKAIIESQRAVIDGQKQTIAELDALLRVTSANDDPVTVAKQAGIPVLCVELEPEPIGEAQFSELKLPGEH